jgi:hypothetical protein
MAATRRVNHGNAPEKRRAQTMTAGNNRTGSTFQMARERFSACGLTVHTGAARIDREVY